MSAKPTIAFIVGNKNETNVFSYFAEHISDLSHFKILVNDTDTKGLEKHSSEIELRYVPSLEKKGDADIAKYAEKRQVAAIFILNAPAISKQLTPDRLAVLVEKSWTHDVTLCTNASNIDVTLSQLISLKGLSGKGVKREKRTVNKAKQQALLAIYPKFDKKSTLEKTEQKREKARMWSQQQFNFLLEESRLDFVKPLVDPEKYKDLATEETKYFRLDEDITNFLRLKCASLEKSIDYLTIGKDAGIRDIWDYSKFEKDFLVSHHEFTTSLKLLQLLRAKYFQPAPENTDPDEDHKPSTTVYNVLRDWILMEYASDFIENDELCQELRDFLKDMAKDGTDGADKAKKIQELLDIAIELVPPYPVDLEKAPKSITPKKNKDTNKYEFLSFSPVEVARQMTLMDEQLFHKVRAKEFLGGAWTKRDSLVRAPNLTKFINHTNRTAAWVVTEILQQFTKENTALTIIQFIKIGKELLEMRNYNGVMNILTALHSAPIGRLKQAWNLVPSKERKEFEELTDALSLLGHYKNYRETLKSLPASTPCIPLIPVTCSDLNGLGEVLPNLTDQGWINWDKHSKVAEHIWSVKRFMRARYILKPVEIVQKYIENSDMWEGDQTLAAIARLRDQETILKRMSEMRETSSSKKLEFKSRGSVKMTEKDWQLLSAGSETKKYGAGEVILPAGVVNRYLYRIKKGTVRVERNINGVINTIAKMKDKDMFGEISMLLRSEQGTTTAAIIADEVTEIIKYKIDFVLNMCRTEPVLSEKLNIILSSKLAERLRSFGSKKIEENPPDKADRKVKDKSEPKESANPVNKLKLEKKTSSIRVSSTKKSKKQKENYEEMKNFFRLPQAENFTSCLSCNLKGPVTQNGSLFISQNYLCFSAAVFGRRTKERMPFNTIERIIKAKNRIDVELPSNKIMTFKSFENLDGAYTIINNFYETAKNTNKGPNENLEGDEDEQTEQEDTILSIPKDRWETIDSGTRKVTYSRDQAIITQGDSGKARLFQLSHGSCRIEKILENGTSVVLGIMKPSPDAIFGEISFLDGSGATASVIANEDNTSVNVIEEFFLDVLFDYYPDLSGRFYHHLATILSTRLKKREQELSGKSTNDDDDTEVTEATEASEDISHTNETTPGKKLSESSSTRNRTGSSKKLMISGEQAINERKKSSKKS